MEKNRKPLYIVIGVIVAVLLVGGAAMLGNSGARPAAQKDNVPAKSNGADEPGDNVSSEGGQAGEEGDEPAAEVHDNQPAVDPELENFLLNELPRRDPDDPTALGKVDAPVVMIEWADFRCPYCAVFAQDRLPELQKYIDSGDLRFEFRDHAIFGEESVLAAVGANAAGMQGKHHEFMMAAFAAADGQAKPKVDEAYLVAIAEQVGVPDMEQFRKDLSAPELELQVLKAREEASQMGISSVPAFVVGTTFISGAQPLDYFEAIIEQELKKAAER